MAEAAAAAGKVSRRTFGECLASLLASERKMEKKKEETITSADNELHQQQQLSSHFACSVTVEEEG